MHKLMLSVALLITGSVAASVDMTMPVNSSDIKWMPAPNFVPPGAQFTVLSGDPSKDGLFVIRIKMPAGYKIAAHSHPTSEFVTVLSGEFDIGMGDKLDMEKGLALKPGGFAEAPAKMNHYAWAPVETIVQVHGLGPVVFNYVNPADDPSKK